MAPFDYPSAPYTRRHGPRGYADYESYRPWLRDEFAFHCVYCLVREQWGPLQGSFTLDHFLPVVLRPDLELEYDNLLYACASCNLSKGGRNTPDPLVAFLSSTVTIDEGGTLVANTPVAGKLIELLGLNRPRLCEFRALWIRIIRLAALFDQPLYRQLLGFPPELPDLAILRPPGSNTRPSGIEQSHRSRLERGELPDTY